MADRAVSTATNEIHNTGDSHRLKRLKRWLVATTPGAGMSILGSLMRPTSQLETSSSTNTVLLPSQPETMQVGNGVSYSLQSASLKGNEWTLTYLIKLNGQPYETVTMQPGTKEIVVNGTVVHITGNVTPTMAGNASGVMPAAYGSITTNVTATWNMQVLGPIAHLMPWLAPYYELLFVAGIAAFMAGVWGMLVEHFTRKQHDDQ